MLSWSPCIVGVKSQVLLSTGDSLGLSPARKLVITKRNKDEKQSCKEYLGDRLNF